MHYQLIQGTFQQLSHYIHHKVVKHTEGYCLHIIITSNSSLQVGNKISIKELRALTVTHYFIETHTNVSLKIIQPLIEILTFFPNIKEIQYNTALFTDNDFINANFLHNYATQKSISFKCLLEVGNNISSTPKQSIPFLRENISSSYKRLINTNIETIIKYRLSPDNIYWADDFIAIISRIPSAKWIVTADFTESRGAVVTHYNIDQAFHAALFFMNLSRRNDVIIKAKLLYRQLSFTFFPSSKDHKTSYIRKYRNKQSVLCFVPEISLFELSPSPIKEEIYYVPPGEIVKNTFNAVQAKLQKKAPAFFRTNSTIASNNAYLSHPSEWRHILITGWYGTETTGDKAILGEVLHFVKTNAPDCRITLTTILDIVSLKTNTELPHLENAAIVPIETAHLPSVIASVDAVIIGGGPLMESSKMLNIWKIFKEANRQSKARIIFGCGIGPIHSSWVRDAATAILQMSTAGFLRDKESFDYAFRLFPQHKLKFACDPAFGFVKRHAGIIYNHAENFIAGLLRANTGEFYTKGGKKELEELNLKAANNLANIIEPVCGEDSIRLKLLHMNAPWIGGDDRMFNRMIEDTFTDKQLVYNERGYLSLDALMSNLKPAAAAMAMRYHGHIFSAALGVPFISIDYTGNKGKVQSLVQRLEYDQWSQKWEDINTSNATQKLADLLDQRQKWSQHLIEKTDELVTQLYDTYMEVFDTRITPVIPSNLKNIQP